MAGGRTSWRDSKLRKPPVAKKRRKKWVLTLILAVCVGWFVWVIFPRDAPDPMRTRLISIVIDRTKSQRVPLLPYPDQRLPEASPRIRIDLPAGTEASSLEAFEVASGDPGSDRAPDSALIVFLRAEGVSLNGRPRILCSDFQENAAVGAAEAPGTIDFSTIVDAVARSNAALKVIVCDYGRTNILPELGLFKNDFASLVAKDVAARKDARDRALYVVLSHAPLQLSEVQHARRGTVFSNAVYDVLSDPRRWDTPETKPVAGTEEQITFREFLAVLRGRCAHHCTGDFAQTPVLIHGGEGIIQEVDARDRDHFLVFVPPEPEKKEGDEPDADKGSGKAKKQAQLTRPRRANPPRYAEASFWGGFMPGTDAARVEVAAFEETSARLSGVRVIAQAGNAAGDGKGVPATPVNSATTPEKAAPATGTATDGAAPQLPKVDNATVVPVNTPAAPANTPASGESKPPKGVASDAEQPPRTEDERAIDASVRAWQAVAAVASRTEGFHWSPVDFSSNDFRDVERELCQLDLQLWTARGSARMAAVTSRLNEISTRIESLDQRITGTSNSDTAGQRRAEPLDRIDVDWRRFGDGAPSRRDLDKEFKRLPDSGLVWAQGEDLLFQLLQNIEWYDAASMSLSSRPPQFDKLQELVDTANGLQWTGWKTAEGVDAVGLTRFANSVQRCQKLASILVTMLEEEGNRVVNELEHANEVDVAIGRSAEVLLSTPLLNLVQRRKLLELLVRDVDEPKESVDAPTATTNESWRSDRATERARLRARLLSLASGQTIEDPADAASFSTTYLNALQSVRRAFSERSAIERHFLTLVCDIRGEVAPLPDVAIQQPPEPDTLDLRLSGPGDIYLDPPTVDRNAGWKSVLFEVSRSGPSRLPVTVSVGSRVPNDVELQLSGHDAENPRIRSIPADAAFPLMVEVRLRASAIAATWGAAPVEIVATASNGSQRPIVQRTPINVYRPTANSIRIEYQDAGPARQASLQVLPSGITPAGLLLVNDTGRKIELEFDLLRSPEPLARSGSTAWLTLRNQLADPATGALTSVGQPLRLMGAQQTFETGDSGSPIRFAVPMPPQAATPEGSVPAAAPPAEPAPVEVSDGLVCVVRERNAPAGIQPIVEVLPVPIVPLHPEEYLDGTARYDSEQGRIVVTARRKKKADRRPIALRIGNPEMFVGSAMESEGLLEDQEASVYVSVPEDGIRRVIALDVDGYPRAFVFQVECAANQRGNTPDRGWTAVRIKRVSVAKSPWAFDIDPQGDIRTIPNPALPDAPPQPVPFPDPLPFVPLKGPVAEPLLVELSGDIPVSNAAQLTLVRSGLAPVVFPSDRKRVFQFRTPEVSGGFDIQCQVSDWRVPVSLAGLNNVEVTVVASLESADSGQTRRAPVAIRIDDSPPVIADRDVWISDGTGLPRLDRVAKNSKTPVYIWVRANDPLSGVGVRGVEIQIHDAQKAAAGAPLFGKKWNEAQGQWRLELNSLLMEMPPDRLYQVDVVARDLLGQTTEEASMLFTLEAGSKPAVGAPDKDTGTISGKVALGSSGKSGFEVELTGPKGFAKKTKSGAGGSFKFTDVPAGEYSLKAAGPAQGVTVSGELSGIKPVMQGEPPEDNKISLK